MTPGLHATVQAGTYSRLIFTANSQDIRLTAEPGVIVSRDAAASGQSVTSNAAMARVRFDGSWFLQGRLEINDIEDLTLYGVEQFDQTSRDFNIFRNSLRVMFERCDLRMTDGYCIFTEGFGSANGGRCSDFIVCNSRLIVDTTAVNEATIRMGGMLRAAVIDNRLVNDPKHCLRAHRSNNFPGELVLWARNQCEGGGVYAIDNPNGSLNTDTLYAYGNELYHTITNLIQVSDFAGGESNLVYFYDNTAYSNAAPADPIVIGPSINPSSENVNNRRFAYQAPPAWSFQ